MTERPIPGQGEENDETLARFPDLARARELYIKLFHDRSPLVNLGYSNKQIEYALPVLNLLGNECEVANHIPNKPYLAFNDSVDPDAEALQVYRLPDSKKGTFLFATRDDSARGSRGLTQEERMWRRFFDVTQQVVIFNDFPEQVAHIALFEDGADMDDLDYLVRQLSAGLFTDAPLGMRAQSILTKAAKAIGVAATYKAAWVDEHKVEFVAQLDTPEDRGLGSVFVNYRKLKSVSDSAGSVIPIGKKANTSEDAVKRILEGTKQRAVPAQLALDGGRI